MKRIKWWLLLSVFVCVSTQAQKKSLYIDSLLRSEMPSHSKLWSNPKKYKLQIIYTQITRDKNNAPHFKNYYWHVDSTRFFYPASLVKLPVSIAALEKIHSLEKYGIDKNTTMITDSVYACQKKVYKDTTSETKYPSIAHYVKKMFLVSDNYSFARTYEFLGCDYLHQTTERWGFPNIRITNRLDASCKADTAKITPPVYFLSEKKDTLYKQALTFYTYNKPHPLKIAKAGKAHTNELGKRIYTPKDFSTHNFMSLANCHEILRRLVFYHHIEEKNKYRLSTEDWTFLMRYLGMYPRESLYPAYNEKEYYDSFKKFIYYGSATPTIPSDSSVRIFNIVGRAYGFLSDCAYVVDVKNKIEFMLSVTMYVNERDIIGTGKYEYNQLGLPFMKDLGTLLYRIEKNRKIKYPADLKEFDLFAK
ncbi:MAG: serine hydrolase [Bacteroidetes bacterium]|nr:serine hydrolase [Bacteroidota bacterium]